MQMPRRPQGDQASRLRQRKFQQLARLRTPAEALPGSLALTHRRCGKPTCHCASGARHPLWLLTFMVEGKKRVEPIPTEWTEEVRQRVEEGKAFTKALHEVWVANADLLALARRQRRR